MCFCSVFLACLFFLSFIFLCTDCYIIRRFALDHCAQSFQCKYSEHTDQKEGHCLSLLYLGMQQPQCWKPLVRKNLLPVPSANHGSFPLLICACHGYAGTGKGAASEVDLDSYPLDTIE